VQLKLAAVGIGELAKRLRIPRPGVGKCGLARHILPLAIPVRPHPKIVPGGPFRPVGRWCLKQVDERVVKIPRGGSAMTEKPSQALQVALAYHQAWTNKDMDQAMTFIADDIVCDAPAGRIEGAEAYRAFMAPLSGS